MMYLVMAIKKELAVGMLGGGELAVDCNWAEGMVGAVPVFKRKEDAEAYAEGRRTIIAVEYMEVK